jgi:hypothetical protein
MDNTTPLYFLIILLAAFVIYLYFKMTAPPPVVISEEPIRYFGRGYNDVWFGPGRDHHSPRMIRHIGPGYRDWRY